VKELLEQSQKSIAVPRLYRKRGFHFIAVVVALYTTTTGNKNMWYCLKKICSFYSHLNSQVSLCLGSDLGDFVKVGGQELHLCKGEE
jgi:hypothetical protein